MKKYIVTKEDAKSILKSILRNHGFVTLNTVHFIRRSIPKDERNIAVIISVGEYDSGLVCNAVSGRQGKIPYSNYNLILNGDGGYFIL